MSLKEIKARHEALISWWLFEGYTVEAMISLINTLHKDRSELIRMVEELHKQLAEHEMYVAMLEGATAWSQEYGDGTVSTKALLKFRSMLDKALEQKP